MITRRLSLIAVRETDILSIIDWRGRPRRVESWSIWQKLYETSNILYRRRLPFLFYSHWFSFLPSRAASPCPASAIRLVSRRSEKVTNRTIEKPRRIRKYLRFVSQINANSILWRAFHWTRRAPKRRSRIFKCVARRTLESSPWPTLMPIFRHMPTGRRVSLKVFNGHEEIKIDKCELSRKYFCLIIPRNVVFRSAMRRRFQVQNSLLPSGW